MRRALFLPALLLFVAGCDSGGTTPIPNPQPVGVTVTYRVSIVGDIFDPEIQYTGADGTAVTVRPDFSRASVYSEVVDLAPGTTGAFSLSAFGVAVVSTGQRINVSILATETSDETNEVASASDIAIASQDSEAVTASAEVDVPLLLEQPE